MPYVLAFSSCCSVVTFSTSKLETRVQGWITSTNQNSWRVKASGLLYSQCSHVVLRVEGDVQQFGPRLDALMTGSTHHLPRHPERWRKCTDHNSWTGQDEMDQQHIWPLIHHLSHYSSKKSKMYIFQLLKCEDQYLWILDKLLFLSWKSGVRNFLDQHDKQLAAGYAMVKATLVRWRIDSMLCGLEF